MWKKSRVYPFVIILKHKQQWAIRFTGILTSLMAIILFVSRAYGEGGSGLYWIAAATVTMLLLWNVFEIKTGRTTRFKPSFIASFLGLALITPHSLLSLPYIALAWLEDEALAAQEIGFAGNEIVLNGIRKRRISWAELNNVVLKDGLLTIDFKNNRLFQQEVDDQEDDEYDGSEDEFNAFCSQQLLLHRADPAK
jgi:hypothetical protein